MSCLDPLTAVRYLLDPSRLSFACQDELGDVLPGQTLSAGLYLSVFALTCLVEAPIYRLFVRDLPWRRFILAMLTINLCTHPLVAFGFPTMLAAAGRPYGQALLTGEAFALVVEALLLQTVFFVPWRRAWLGALTANFCSWTLGALVFTPLF